MTFIQGKRNSRFSGDVPSLEKLDKLVNLEVAENHLGYGREVKLPWIKRNYRLCSTRIWHGKRVINKRRCV
ncbi:hypothetical protein V6N13_038581 [Hibiscus sabdariffa]|uniref:Uncharacterized protein n=2 Tax=Hibiscus sabdariffa TaxID=183260 RepID=A0ABR2NBZ9_9ROSI